MKNRAFLITLIIIVLGGISGYFLLSNNGGDSTNTVAEQETAKNCTSYGNRINEQCAEDYEGLNVDEAVSKAENNGLVPKIIEIDGENRGGTLEGSTPIFFEVNNRTITKAYFQ